MCVCVYMICLARTDPIRIVHVIPFKHTFGEFISLWAPSNILMKVCVCMRAPRTAQLFESSLAHSVKWNCVHNFGKWWKIRICSLKSHTATLNSFLAIKLMCSSISIFFTVVKFKFFSLFSVLSPSLRCVFFFFFFYHMNLAFNHLKSNHTLTPHNRKRKKESLGKSRFDCALVFIACASLIFIVYFHFEYTFRSLS